MTNQLTKNRIKVYYDGACHLCSREISYYYRLDHDKKFEWINIAAPEFNSKAEGLDPVQIQKVMHVRLPSGKIKTAVEAFIVIWSQYPKFKHLAWFASQPWIKPFLTLGYHSFARVRKILPRQKHCPLPPRV